MPKPPGPVAKRLKLKDDSVSGSDSASTRTSRKTRGKMMRSNEKIGTLTMDEAIKAAEKITGFQKIDLRLTHRRDSDAANSMKWISTFDEDDVVIQRKLCMICKQSPMDAFFKSHVAQAHPATPSEASEVMRRLSDVRYSRFCQNGQISKESIQKMFPTISPILLINFLAGLGFIICRKDYNKKSVNFEKKYQGSDVRGVSKSEANEILNSLKQNSIRFLDELEFSAEIVTNARMLDPSTQSTVQCHICDKISNLKNFTRHMQIHRDSLEILGIKYSLDDVIEIFKRITDVRNTLYYAAQPISQSKIMEICEGNVEVQRKLVSFLLDAGFVVADTSKYESLAQKIIVMDPEMPELIEVKEEPEDCDEKYELPILEVSEPGSSEPSESRTRSRSSSVTSDTSSISSTSSTESRIILRPCSSPSDEQFPYCVLNAIPEHFEVEHALFDILEAMTDDSEFKLEKSQFGFLLGYTMYCLVVANGSKQNVISRLTLGDFRNSKIDEQSGLHYFSFSTKTTCKKLDTLEYLCADERIWRALEIFEVARERRALEMKWSTLNENSAPFFFSFVSPSPIVKDTNYWLSIFLRSCGIDWLCKSNNICSAAWSLVFRDSNKTSHQQYAITYFKLLREKERSQIQFLDGGLAGHPTYRKISSVVISKKRKNHIVPHEKIRKKQKRYRTPERIGIPNRPRGGDHKSLDFKRRTGRYVEPESPEDSDETDKVQESVICHVKEDPIDSTYFDSCECIPTPLEMTSHSSSQLYQQYRVKVEGDVTLTCL
ncbi:C2H2-type domain-containing protein [Caenorhabditis elegans]|uniref:C2H2-type domain-containing protein n=1 Tax=Caenorhabditis elegans TaxID=6239 RepID=Q9N5R8_CAEEL|nr:C2H2-type domain-containing protein [Caenorhabditis elegans]CCD66833.1 C2H2-type domain-containing protein [Caenorhabditis elegans]|eukprot:NP_492822.2 Uncharacterized protein CELE_F55A3.2 [Caenorhabditis elegans]